MPAQAQAQAQQAGFCQILNRPARIRRGLKIKITPACSQAGEARLVCVRACGHLLPLLSLCAFVGEEDVPTTPPGPGRECMDGY